MDTELCRLGLPYNYILKYNILKLINYSLITSLSVEDLRSTPGKATLVNHPNPLQNSKMELANLAVASSTTLPTPSTFRRLVLV